MGTPDFARVALEKLYNSSSYHVLAVFSQPDRPKGRGKKLSSPPCAEFAKEKNIPLYQPLHLKDEDSISIIKNLNPDFIVVAAYGLFLPQKILDIPKYDTLNIHASLLPKYRGAAPINYAILNGEEKTGVSIMRVIKKMDAGAVYAQSEISISSDDTTLNLTEKLSSLGGDLLLDTIPKIIDGKIKAIDQDESLVSHASLMKKEDGNIDWSDSCENIQRKIRAYYPWPSAFTFIEGKRLKIFESEIIEDQQTLKKSGEILHMGENGIEVQCGKGCLRLKIVQLEGKSKARASDFARGFRLELGMRFDPD